MHQDSTSAERGIYVAGSRNHWRRGLVTLGVIGALTTAMLASPVGAAFNPTKAAIKKIAGKVVTKKGSELFALHCPAGTVPFADVCIETTERANAMVFDAMDVCAALDRRLPTVNELWAFQRLGNQLPFAELTGEFTRNAGDEVWFVDNFVGDNLDFAPAFIAQYHYRCVAAPIQGPG